MRAGVWNEQKVLFMNRGHDHRGGRRGAHIQGARGLATGCIQILNPRPATSAVFRCATLLSTNAGKRRYWYGGILKTRDVATTYTVGFGGATGFAGLDWARVTAPREGRIDNATVIFYNYLGRASMLNVFLAGTLGRGAAATCFVEVWGV